MVPHLLVVEDDPTSRNLLAHLLVDMGYSVTSSASAEEALRILDAAAYCDAVLADVVMPGISGVELAIRLRNQASGPPVILITGVPRGFALADESSMLVISKPVTRRRLAAVLADVIQPIPGEQ